MMRRKPAPLAALAFAATVAVSAPASVLAQDATTSAGSASRARSVNERVNTEAGTPPPVNSDYRRAAEGTLPLVPGQVPIGGGAIDPAARPLGAAPGSITGTLNGNAGRSVALPPGMDVALLVDHALAMGIDSSILSSLAQAKNPDEAGNDSVKKLMTSAGNHLRESKELLAKAASAGNDVDANSPVRKFYAAASEYMTTLGTLSSPGTLASPNDKAELAGINQSVKAVMEANHLMHLGSLGTPSPALDALLDHARKMKDEATRNLEQMAGATPVDPSAPMSPIILAQRGRELVDAAGQLAPLVNQSNGFGANPTGPNGALIDGQGPNPGRFQDNRPQIIGGTYGTGSQTSGTSTGPDAARNVSGGSTVGPNGVLNVPTPTGTPGSGTSGYGVGNNNTPPTSSTAGPRPR